jgi:hypothetical protein
MKLPWIVLHHHRHGVDAWLHWSEQEPTLDDVLKGYEDFEEDRDDEYVEILPGNLSNEEN